MKFRTYLPRRARWPWVILAVTACTVSPSTPIPASLTPTPSLAPTSLPTSAPTPMLPAYWPTNGWRTSTPEQQGMDSSKFVAMLDDIQKHEYPIQGIVVVRNGYSVLEAYFHPYQAESQHLIYSATKSITSALVGIAIQQGYIDGISHKLLDYFSDRTIANVDQRKQAITLEHLLTMSSGLDWPTHGGSEDLWNQFSQSRDWVRFVLNRPMAEEPGTRFNYNSGSSHLLSAIIQKTTGMSTLDFAQKNLFGPLGISNVSWMSDPNGINWGCSGIALTPRDMAKFGYLYLNNGIWAGRPIVPAEWVKASSASHIDMGDFGYRYGYLWWVDPADIYKAGGSNGQRIFVVPEQKMVVVFVGGSGSLDEGHVPENLLASFIIPAVKSTEPLPANPEQTTLLEARLQAIAHPEPKPVPPLPAMAYSVSGKLYTLLQDSPLGIKGFALNFRDDQASIKAYFMIGSQELAIGLDDVYRSTAVNVPTVSPTSVAMKGSWISSDTFAISMFLQNNLSETHLFFKDDRVYMTTHDGSGDQTIEGALNVTYPTPSSTNVSLGQHPNSSQIQIENADGTSQTVQVNYLLYLPEAYGKDPQEKWPLILFLHGIGERGIDLNLLKKHPLPKTLDQQTDFPYIVVSPQQSLKSELWSDMLVPLNGLLDQISAIYSVDPKRIYLTGLSMGGAGTWQLGLLYPKRFAALAPVAGFYQHGSRVVPSSICDLKDVPIWVFHGGRDTDVPSYQSEVLVDALKACGGNVRFTFYPDADHEGAFNQAYADPALYQWLSAQTRK